MRNVYGMYRRGPHNLRDFVRFMRPRRPNEALRKAKIDTVDLIITYIDILTMLRHSRRFFRAIDGNILYSAHCSR